MTKHRKTLPLHTVQLVNESRRGFMKAGAGLALGIYLSPLLGDAADVLAQAPAAPPMPKVPPSAFLRIAADGGVTVISKHLEMGQGTFTGLATLIAEELDADWSRVSVEGAPADVSKYGNLAFGGAVQGTGGSTAMAGAWQQMRMAGAAARAMLVAAAAEQWQVPAKDITVSSGTIAHKASNRSAHFGEFAEAAAKLPVPENPTLKTPDQYVLIGKDSVRRRDSAAKVNGSAQFTQDVHLPGMLVAVIARAPRYGAKVASFDDSAARAIPGVVAAFAVPGKDKTYEDGVAVLAKDTWTALKARKALKIEWDESRAWRGSSDSLLADYRKLAATPGAVAVSRGNAAAAIEGAAKTVDAEYSVPYLAHASMEPLNCVVQLTANGGCEIWNGEQFHTPDQGAVAAQLGATPDKVLIHQLYAGGSFGRRANPKSEYILQAVQVAQLAAKAGHNVPVKTVWSREDDTAGGYYRPLALHVARAGLDAQGNIVGWTHRIVGQSIAKGSPFEAMMIKDGVDESLIEGISDLPYDAAALHVDLHIADNPVTTQWWRSVGHTHTGFAAEAFVDELAAAAGKDPYVFRRERLDKHPRERGVLDLVAQKAGWDKPLAKGKDGERRGRGIAVHKSFGSYVAQVAEVTVHKDGSVKVDRVVCAVDCGIAINPDVIRAQMEGGIGYGLSAALHGAITFKDGLVQQSNFHDYKQLRIHEMPKIDVFIVPSEEKPTGVGEPGTAVIAPAFVNAIANATGTRVRQLPLDPASLRA
ncbi:xanthine dehydrogenase family protein molybdopterin-binding subunit [Chiayiivirga flava]|uniref:Isoquinoline 1-oxidoreductase beta subunit n=1 Tax=Chiayiivirga flava TaxID=659595 RepID=A0A7W8D7F7_9GAMM|nr:xanthine dehydrogenase family protein molybdopterin-binding subunit [Chiayiivirga flava]MBB5208112.1 isoquinoline 1-oxidoreductase beta subunit [Chiayiivirga flava]